MPGKERLIPIFIVVFVDILGFSIILPLLPFYASKIDAADTSVGPLIASYSLCQFIAAPILGNLSDTYGRRPILLYSQFGSFLGFILLGLAMHLPQPLIWLFAARMIDGLWHARMARGRTSRRRWGTSHHLLRGLPGCQSAAMRCATRPRQPRP